MFISAVKDRAAWFDQKLASQVKELTTSIQQFEMEMLQEMAETLLVCSGHLTEDILHQHVENNLYFLFKCSVDSLQKAAFVLLKYIYQNFIPPVEFSINEQEEIEKLKSTNFEEGKTQALDHKIESKAKREAAFKNLPLEMIAVIDEAPAVDVKDNTEEM